MSGAVSPAVSPAGAPTVRPMRWPDLTAVSALEARLFPEDAWSTASWWAELAGRPRRDYVVLVDGDGTLAGYAGLDVGPEVADVMTIAVDADRQGSGLGRVLLAELLDRARAAGATALMLEVRADNTAATRLYTGHGFTIVRTRRGYYPGRIDALVMRAPLGEEEVAGDG